MDSDLHPHAERVLELRADRERLPYHSLAVDAAREAFTEHMTGDGQPPAVGNVRTIAIESEQGPLRIRIYSPDGCGPHPILVYFHGGGWVLGNLETHDSLCRAMARRAQSIVIAVDYRKAPEHTFPAPIDDAYRAIEWATANAQYIDGDPERIAVGGDSVGGTVATSVARLTRERNGPGLLHQLLLHPVTDSTVDTASYEEYGSGFIGSRAGMDQYWRYFVRGEFDYANPYAAPLRAPDLGELPPASLFTCEFDPLRDEGIAYAERLRDADVLTKHTHETDVFHGYFASVDFMDRAANGVDRVAEHLRGILHQ